LNTRSGAKFRGVAVAVAATTLAVATGCDVAAAVTAVEVALG
jgi:hypothetical protein